MGIDSRTAHHMGAAKQPPIGRSGARMLIGDAVALAGLAALVLPAVATIGAPVHGALWQAVAAVVTAAVAARFGWAIPPARFLPFAGLAMISAACWLLAQASYPVAAWLVAPTLGLGVAFVSSRPVGSQAVSRAVATRASPIAVAAVAILIARLSLDRDAAMACGALIAAASAVTAITAGRFEFPTRRSTWFAAVGGAALALTTVGYVGATTPSVTWFGSLIHHGPRERREVAITFDDGPNPPYTLEISAILDRYGAKGTFFVVGKALETRPDVAQALLSDGHLLGNHSYSHDAFQWLNPGYPELAETQDAFKRTLGICPAFFRPPHGSHTPFMARAVSDRGMHMVTWDVSAADWATQDGELVARRVLDKVKPGSIILLHDGSDGNIGADRSVLLTALPIILNGLRDRGLMPVTLDTLLDLPGYLPEC